MKIHKITLDNLASLYGKHSIDFDKTLCNASLFLITGPTGAGKSTLLDAICLALFGQTPRLHCTARQTDSDVRKILSHGTEQGSASLDFSIWNGQERQPYRAVWSCRRAARSGALQKPHRSLSILQSNGIWHELVSSNLQKVYEPIFEQVLKGFSVDDFQRSMLLAQGAFAAFLHASEDQKASILEHLTSTQIYQKIGQSVAALRKQKEKEMEGTLQHLQNVALLSDEEVQNMHEKHRSLFAEMQEQQRLQEKLRELQSLLEKKQGHQNQIVMYESQCHKLQRKLQEFDLQQAEQRQEEQKLHLEQMQKQWQNVYPHLTALRLKQQKQKLLQEQILLLKKEMAQQHSSVQAMAAQSDKRYQTCCHLEDSLRLLQQNILQLSDGKLTAQQQKEQFQWNHMRQKLKQGQPCFLCGSCQHPYICQNETTQGDREQTWAFAWKQWQSQEQSLINLHQEQKEGKIYWNHLKCSLQHTMQACRETQSQINTLQKEQQIEATALVDNMPLCTTQEMLDQYEQNLLQQMQQQQKRWQESLLHLQQQQEQMLHQQSRLSHIESTLQTERLQLQAMQQKILERKEPESAQNTLQVQEKIQSLLLQCGGLMQRMQEQNTKKEQQENLQKNLHALQQEYGTWKHISDFIGDEKGLKFKRMAQVFNLEGLVLRANVRLQSFAPRYRLTIAKEDTGASRLAFSVCDACHAGAARAVTTLSGGETFLLSLALALALADYHWQKMPIETLLLDEGFGTLDEETLYTVISALEQLPKEALQIGIISHVQALQQHIPARIVVCKESNGRASLQCG